MSIEARIVKKCVMSSLIEFYKFIKDKHELMDKYVEFRIFRDHMFLSINGCECTREENENVSEEIYRKFNLMNQQAFVDIKSIIKCSSIIFKLNDELLFEL